MEKKEYVMNIQSKIIHVQDGCYNSKIIKPENQATFFTIGEAIAAAKTKYSFNVQYCKHCFKEAENKK